MWQNMDRHGVGVAHCSICYKEYIPLFCDVDLGGWRNYSQPSQQKLGEKTNLSRKNDDLHGTAGLQGRRETLGWIYNIDEEEYRDLLAQFSRICPREWTDRILEGSISFSRIGRGPGQLFKNWKADIATSSDGGATFWNSLTSMESAISSSDIGMLQPNKQNPKAQCLAYPWKYARHSKKISVPYFIIQ